MTPPPIIWYMPEIGLASATDPKGFHSGAVPYMLARPMPIETAPRDGTWVLAWLPSVYWWAILRWEFQDWEDDDGDGGYAPTHWLPMPPAPEDA